MIDFPFWNYNLRIHGKKQKFARLQREKKQHKQNCWKAQRIKEQLMVMIHET